MTDDLAMRLLVVGALLMGVGLVGIWWRGRLRRIRHEVVHHPPLPADLVRGRHTWVVFTTPWCATCGPTVELLRGVDHDSEVVTVDVTDRPALARQFSVRAAPTVLRADPGGAVTVRLVGASAVRDYLSEPAMA